MTLETLCPLSRARLPGQVTPSRTGDMEEVCSESSRKMQDKEEIASEASWTAATKKEGKYVWRLEPEGEAEKPEVTVFVERGGRRLRESGR